MLGSFLFFWLFYLLTFLVRSTPLDHLLLYTFKLKVHTHTHTHTHIYVSHLLVRSKGKLFTILMAFTGYHMGKVAFATLVAIFVAGANAIDVFLEWNVVLDNTIQPVSLKQPV